MKTLVFLVSLLVILTQCMTDRRNVRRITGEWELTKYKQTDNLGFTTLYSASGNFKFTSYKKKAEKGTFTYQFSYDTPNTSISKSEVGEYYSNADDEAFYLLCKDENGNLKSTQKFHIDILTTTDVILQYNDITVNHTFVLRKKS